MSQNLISIYEKLVEFLGGQTKAAEVLLIKQPSVNAWLKGKNLMSEVVAMRAQRVTKGRFKAKELCPALKEFEM
ncbi:YdaS family helix-turn-helix protein [Acinetobacter pittii]|uniref:YdaS family helix-turn-helix protein n=1 Tax=Acinetobacter pittii TaxID=48296 RepID=UPI003261AEFC